LVGLIKYIYLTYDFFYREIHDEDIGNI